MTVSSRKNDNVKLVRELFRDKKVRCCEGKFAVEGDHLCGELAKSGYDITLFLYTERAEEKYPETVSGIKEKARDFAVITEELSEYISDTKAPQGMFAAAKMPCAKQLSDSAKKLVVLDGVQDPGNVGTIIRTAEALGLDGAVLSENCADIYSPKTLRASMGSALRLPCITGRLAEILPTLKQDGFTLYGALLDREAKRLGEFRFSEKSAVVIGSEGAGVSEEVRALCNSVYIPITGAESLNAAAAAAIILWELTK